MRDTKEARPTHCWGWTGCLSVGLWGVRFARHCCLHLVIFGETIDHSPCVICILTNMRHLIALILGPLALFRNSQTSLSSSSASTYTPIPAADPNAQLDNVQSFAYNAAMENLTSAWTLDKVQVRREWYVNCSKSALPKPLLVKRTPRKKGKGKSKSKTK
jgi:hypothetical protein